MSRNSIIILLGILIILAPFSGLPAAVRTLLEVVLGACVAGIGLSLRVRAVQEAQAAAVIETPLGESAPVQGVSAI